MNKIILKLHHTFNLLIMEKCINSTYEYVVDKDFIEQKALAINAYKSDKLTAVIIDFFSIINSVIIVLGMSYVMNQFSYVIWISLVVVILINVITSYYSKKANYQMDQYDAVYNVKTSYLRGVANDFNAAKDIRTFDISNGIKRKMDEYSKESHKKMNEYYSSFFIKNTLIDIAGFIFNAIIYIYLGYRLLIQNNISLSEFVFMIGAVTSVYSALQSLTNNFVSLNSNIIYAKDFYKFLDIKSENTFDKHNITLPIKAIKSMEIKNLSFKYPGCDDYAIKNMSIKFEPGNAYMIVGENGAGKSTLIKLILRLYDNYTGEILINGINIKSFDYELYLNIFTVLFQDFNMLSIPISQNISTLKDDIDYIKINNLINMVGLSEKIDSLAKGIDNPIYRLFDQDGADFSGGEMQKLALARALYKDSMIAIFDEPSSALDVYSESTVLDCIKNISNQQIAIYTTHRFSSKNIASKIIVLENGTILEQGTHEYLMEIKGAYYNLFTLQASNYIREESI